MSRRSSLSFKVMSLVYETLHGLFRDPYKALDAAGLGRGQKVVEVGCGPGFFTIPAARVVGEPGSITALDVDPLAVKHIQRKVKEQGQTNVEVLLANVTQADLPPRSFDLILLFGFARSIGDVEAIFGAAHRLLKPEGILSIEGRLRPPDRLFQPIQRQGRIAQFRRVG